METTLPHLSLADRPRLAAGCRLHVDEDSGSSWLVMQSDECVRLNDSAAEILRRCNGELSVASLLADLSDFYVGSDGDEVSSGVQAFLDLAVSRGWLDLSAELG